MNNSSNQNAAKNINGNAAQAQNADAIVKPAAANESVATTPGAVPTVTPAEAMKGPFTQIPPKDSVTPPAIAGAGKPESGSQQQSQSAPVVVEAVKA